jgi:hypothetical protein
MDTHGYIKERRDVQGLPKTESGGEMKKKGKVIFHFAYNIEI